VWLRRVEDTVLMSMSLLISILVVNL